jgi:peptidoglycan/LPS O-acetylase OafA/YrhL
VLVLAVIAYHLWSTGDGWHVDPGSVAVDGFFALSGYLITGLLIKEHDDRGRVSMPNFYRRRALRLLPALVFFLVVWLAVDLIFSNGQFLATVPSAHGPGHPVPWMTGLEAVGAALFYVTNLMVIAPISHLWYSYSPISHLWTLAVEEQFYLLWAPALLLLLSLRRRSATLITIGIALVALLEPWAWTGSDFNRLYFGTDTRCAALFCGAACAYIGAADGWRWLRRLWTPVLGLGVVAVLVWSSWAMRQESHDVNIWIIGLELSSVAWALGVVYLVERPWGLMARFLASDLVVAVGQRSYAFYLWSYVMNTWLRDTGPWESVLVIGCTFAAAEVSYRLVEVPMLRRKSRIGQPKAVHVDRAEEPCPPVSPQPARVLAAP